MGCIMGILSGCKEPPPFDRPSPLHPLPCPPPPPAPPLAPRSLCNADTPFRQQRVKSWLPILQPPLVVGIFFAIGVVFIPLGKWFQEESNTVRAMPSEDYVLIGFLVVVASTYSTGRLVPPPNGFNKQWWFCLFLSTTKCNDL